MSGDTHHHLFETALGTCGVAWNARGLAGVQLPEKDRVATARRLAAKCGSIGESEPPHGMAAVVEQIQKYLAGEKIDFSGIEVDLNGVDEVCRKIYRALRTIGFGHTTTYGELARSVGMAEWVGARDVGEAMGRNPIPVVIPCHRVLAANGKLGGFSAYGGTTTKQKLLALEGVHADGGAPRLPGF
jgi:methylated-DNA-[protein]-cysteine S-methyltransferase